MIASAAARAIARAVAGGKRNDRGRDERQER